MAARGHKTYTCATENSELGIFWTGKQTNRKTWLEIFMIFYIFFLFLVFNFRMLKIQVYKICPNRISKDVCKSLYGSPAYKCVVLHLAVSASIHLSAGTCVCVCMLEVMRKTLNEVL